MNHDPESIGEASYHARLKMVRKMANAAINALEEDEYNALYEWGYKNLTCDVHFVLQDAIKLAIAFDGGAL